MVLILNQINLIITIPFYLSMILLILSSHMQLILQSGLFLSCSHNMILYTYFFSLHSRYTIYPSNSSSLDHSNYTWRRVHVMKLLIMQVSPNICHFIPLRSKYFPQHTVHTHSQSMLKFPSPYIKNIQQWLCVQTWFTFVTSWCGIWICSWF
jgi:hypothetical protein